MNGLGATGAQQSKDCSFAAGTVSGAPLRISWFLVIFFVSQAMDKVKETTLPVWMRVALVCGHEFLLLLTVLCHELGHGTMARRRGGDISQILLWPFGGICFSTRPKGRSPHQKLVDDLWIVAAGPATHFPMAGVWVLLLSMFAYTLAEQVQLDPAWSYLNPLHQGGVPLPCSSFSLPHGYTHCLSDAGYLASQFLTEAVKLNVMLFVFNVFFPMYPMDGAKLIVCSLQLFCKTSARFAAKVLVYTSTPLACFFIFNAFRGMKRASGSGLQPGLYAYMGFMCLSESYKIYKLMKEERLYTHPLFELARSDTRAVSESGGITTRLNTAERDDVESSSRAPRTNFTSLRPFSGSGQPLGSTSFSQLPDPHPRVEMQQVASNQQTTSTASRSSWLSRLERSAADRHKTVGELQADREQLVRVPGAASTETTP